MQEGSARVVSRKRRWSCERRRRSQVRVQGPRMKAIGLLSPGRSVYLTDRQLQLKATSP
jgi:hypothetical protein